MPPARRVHRSLSGNSQRRAHHANENAKRLLGKCLARYGLRALVLVVALWFSFLIRRHRTIIGKSDREPSRAAENRSQSSSTHKLLPSAFHQVLERAAHMQGQCRGLQAADRFTGFDMRSELPFGNETVASLPSFGIIDALQWKPSSDHSGSDWQCELPPETECAETQFTVVFMAYNPDRLDVTFRQIKKMLNRAAFNNMVQEIVLVWNGPRHIDESETGQKMLEYANSNPLRIAYPLKMGFTNDLMNRYHPAVVNVKTKAILYYDDDGPFYSPQAIQGGFELWKRHAKAQLGAMARQINYSKRQIQERLALSSQPDDKQFVSHCTNVEDVVEYNFRYFANYDANMVLPSGSFLHSNYLCFLWHPALEPIRQFVRAHPVHPDDVTVSMVVSQLAGRAPRVYSRRLNPDDTKDKKKKDEKAASAQRARRLTEEDELEYEEYDFDEDVLQGILPASEQRRSLLFGIDWDASQKMSSAKEYWAALRTEAVNSLVRYFGSINSGSIGWCEGTKYYSEKKEGKCFPIMAKQGWLPWMNPDGSPKATCP